MTALTSFKQGAQTRARTQIRTARRVVDTAASWGLLPNGAAMKNDQLARERPARM